MNLQNEPPPTVTAAAIEQVKAQIQREIDAMRTTSHEIGRSQFMEVRGRLKSLLELTLIEHQEYLAMLGLAESHQWGKLQRVPISDT